MRRMVEHVNEDDENTERAACSSQYSIKREKCYIPNEGFGGNLKCLLADIFTGANRSHGSVFGVVFIYLW